MSNFRFYSRQQLPSKQQQFDEQNLAFEYDRCLDNLKTENQVKSEALGTAQALIANYTQQNRALTQENRQLVKKVQKYEERLRKFESMMMDVNYYQQQLIVKSAKINELLETNQNLQKRHKQLKLKYKEKEKKKQLNHKTVKLIRNAEKQLKQKYNNYDPVLDYTVNNRSSTNKKAQQSEREAQLQREVSILRQKLQDKDQQIILILRRNKSVEDKYYELLKETRTQLRYRSFSTDLQHGRCYTSNSFI